MTRDEARRKLETLARPKSVRLEVSDTLSSEEKRAAAHAAFTDVKSEIAACDDRIAAIIAAHEEIQALYAKRRTLRPKAEALNRERWHFKFTAEKSDGFAWELMGNGDTWEQVIAKATERSKRKG